MKKILCTLYFLLSTFFLLASVPLKWTVETSRVQPVVFDAVRGETLALEASFNSYGTPLQLPANAALFYQTNGMGPAWWTIPATVSATNRISAVFAPTNDPGAASVVGFLGTTGEIYRALFTLRFRHGPGATPNAISVPVPILDFAKTIHVNAPWTATNDFIAATNDLSRSISSHTSLLSQLSHQTNLWNTATNKQDRIADYTTTNAVRDIAASAAVTNAGAVAAAASAANAAYYPKANGEAWSSYWDGDDVRVTVTNYDSAVNLPSLYLEQRTNETVLATNLFRTVWREMAHWESFLGTNWNWRSAWSGFKTWMETITSEIAEKADRAWGYYDSHTGEYSPDGYTQISSSNVMIAAGMSYQKTATATADVWILTANEPYEPTGVATNNSFQLKDADGNVQFEIIKGDKTTVAAQAHAVGVTNSTLYVVYNIVAASAPTAQVCLDLSTASWKTQGAADCPATVTWTGSSGRYVAAITPNVTTAKCFVKATYQRGGDTYINNRCAVGMSQIVLNGTTYTLGTATIDGHTVLTLTPAN